MKLFRLIASFVCIHACMAGLRMTAPLFALSMGYSKLAIGVLLALFSLTQVFLALPAGRYADRHGLRRPLLIAVIAGVSGTAIALIYPAYATLCTAALITGGATGMASITLQRHVGRLATDSTQLKQVFSWLALGPALSNFIGPFCAGLMIDYAGGFRSALALLAMFPLLGWWFAHDAPELSGNAKDNARDKEKATAQTRPRAWDLLRAPVFRRLLLVNWFLSSCWDVHTFVVPVLGHERAMSASVIGTILGSFAIAAACVRLAIPVLAKHVQEWAVITTAMLTTAALFGIYPLLPNPWAMGLCSVLLGLALGSVQPMVMSTLHQITPHARHGEALALRLMTINASSVAMPMLFGASSAALGVHWVFWIVGSVVGLGSRVAYGLKAGLRVDKKLV